MSVPREKVWTPTLLPTLWVNCYEHYRYYLFSKISWVLVGQALQCSCLENPRDGGAWWAAISGVAQSRTRLKRLSSSSILLSEFTMATALLLFSQSALSDSLQPHGLQHTRLPCHLPISRSLLKLLSIESVMPFNHLVLCHPLFLLPSIFQASGSFIMSQLFASHGQSIGASASASVLPMNIQGWSPCSPRGSQESSPEPQFKSISSSSLSLLCGPTLTSIHDYWKNHSFDYTNLCWQTNVSAF